MKTTLTISQAASDAKLTTYTCGECGHLYCYDLTQGLGEVRNVCCAQCGARYYKGRWWTFSEWQAMVNEGFEAEIARLQAADQSAKITPAKKKHSKGLTTARDVLL